MRMLHNNVVLVKSMSADTNGTNQNMTRRSSMSPALDCYTRDQLESTHLNSHGNTGVHRIKPTTAPSSKTVSTCELTAFDACGWSL